MFDEEREIEERKGTPMEVRTYAPRKEKMFSMKKAAEVLEVNMYTLLNWAKKDKVHTIKKGVKKLSPRFMPVSELNRLLEVKKKGELKSFIKKRGSTSSPTGRTDTTDQTDKTDQTDQTDTTDQTAAELPEWDVIELRKDNDRLEKENTELKQQLSDFLNDREERCLAAKEVIRESFQEEVDLMNDKIKVLERQLEERQITIDKLQVDNAALEYALDEMKVFKTDVTDKPDKVAEDSDPPGGNIENDGPMELTQLTADKIERIVPSINVNVYLN